MRDSPAVQASRSISCLTEQLKSTPSTPMHIIIKTEDEEHMAVDNFEKKTYDNHLNRIVKTFSII